MGVKAVLILDHDIEVNVLSFSFSYSKQRDSNGRPTNKTVFNGINLVIETRKDLNLADWAMSRTETKQLELNIYPRFFNGKTRKLTLYDCHLLGWENEFSSVGDEPLKETLQISCGGVKDSNSTKQYAAYWRKTFDSDVEPTVLPQNEEEEVHIISCRYTDRDGNPISELYEGDEITLTVVTEDAVGKTINLDLSEFEFGFKHMGKVLKDNLLERIKVTANEHKIDLDVIELDED